MNDRTRIRPPALLGLLILCAATAAFAPGRCSASIILQAELLDDEGSGVGSIRLAYDESQPLSGVPNGSIPPSTTFFFVTDALIQLDGAAFDFPEADSFPTLSGGLTLTEDDRIEPALGVIPGFGPAGALLVEGPADPVLFADIALFTWTFAPLPDLNVFFTTSDFGVTGVTGQPPVPFFSVLGRIGTFQVIPEPGSQTHAAIALGIILTALGVRRVKPFRLAT